MHKTDLEQSLDKDMIYIMCRTIEIYKLFNPLHFPGYIILDSSTISRQSTGHIYVNMSRKIWKVDTFIESYCFGAPA